MKKRYVARAGGYLASFGLGILLHEIGAAVSPAAGLSVIVIGTGVALWFWGSQ